MTLLSQGQLIGGRYEIGTYVGAGGMQEVYKAWDRSLKRIVAIKTPKNASATKRFSRSAEMSARVTHPNVAKTYDYLEDLGSQYLIEEFVAGEDLKLRFATHFIQLDPHLASHVFHHLVRGLAAVHAVGVIHRDLKPSNVMVSRDENISVLKLTDFGVAKMAEEEIKAALKDNDEASMMSSATVVGALPYMAPEVIGSKQDVSDKADIWSCGAMLYQFLTGQRPFGDGILAVPNILSGKVPGRPVQLASNPQFALLCDELWRMVTMCLSMNPNDRPDAKALAAMCSQICYSDASRCTGRVKNFASFNGRWGFVVCDDDLEEVFFHGDSWWGGKIEAGGRVSLSRFLGAPQERAYPVLLLHPEVKTP